MAMAVNKQVKDHCSAGREQATDGRARVTEVSQGGHAVQTFQVQMERGFVPIGLKLCRAVHVRDKILGG